MSEMESNYVGALADQNESMKAFENLLIKRLHLENGEYPRPNVSANYLLKCSTRSSSNVCCSWIVSHMKAAQAQL